MTRIYAKIQVEKHGVQSTSCDGCGKHESGEPRDWLHLNYSHNDWDGAGEESADERDACSAGCLIKVLAAITADYEPLRDAPTLSIWLGSVPYAVAHDLGELSQSESAQ